MKHRYFVEHISRPSITDPTMNEWIYQITYSRNGSKENPIPLRNEDYVFALIQEFIRYHPNSIVDFKPKGEATPIGLIGLEKKVEEYREQLRKGEAA